METDFEENERVYREHRKSLIDGELAAAAAFDKYMLMLSGGALALSMTFLRDIAGPGPFTQVTLLVGAWVLLVLSITSVLVSLIASQRSHDRYKEILDREHARGGVDFLHRASAKMDKCCAVTVVVWANRTAIGTFVAAVFFLLIFTAANFQSEPSHSQGDKYEQEAERTVTRVTE